jgi:glutathione S-transferase
MITLYQFARVWSIPNLSPFCCKVETYLRMAGIAYQVAAAVPPTPPTAPRGQLPYITDDGRTIGDSRLIIEYLRDQYHADLDQSLTPEERAESMAFQRLIEDHLYWAVMWSRWSQPHNWPVTKQAIFGRFPPVVRDVMAGFARRHMRRLIRGQGLGRHAERDIMHLGNEGLTALSDFLGDKPFFLGGGPTTLDASAFGLLSNVLWPPIESPLKTHARGLGNLVAFCERVRDRYFREDAKAAPGGAPHRTEAYAG